MKKFKCTVTRIDEYEIEIDETVIDKKYMEDFRSVFYPFFDLEEHAEHLAQVSARFGSGGFIEGYGMVKRNGEISYPYNTKEYEGKVNKEDIPINIKVISEDDDCEVEVEEII